MEIRKDILWRVYLSFIGIILLGVAVLGRAFYIQSAEGRFWKDMGEKMHLRYFPVNAPRGSIYSEDGNMLSTSVPIYDVFIDFTAEGLRKDNGKLFKKYLDSVTLCLAGLFADNPQNKAVVKKAAAQLKREFQQAYDDGEDYYPFRRRISFQQYIAMREFPLLRKGPNSSGFIFHPRDKRIYPYGLMANRTIGISRDSAKSNVGLELSYDSFLRGTSGQQLMRRIAGSYVPVEGAELDPENGKDIITTLDTYIQNVAEDALLRKLESNNSLHGTVIVMETSTGKIKAIANLGRTTDSAGVVVDSTFGEIYNYATGKATEPGSIFKLATLLALIDDKHVDKNTVVNLEGGRKKFANLTIRDSHKPAKNEVTVKEAFLESSNVAFAKLADQYYGNRPEKFTDRLHQLKLDEVMDIGIKAVSGKPTIKKPTNRSWSGTTIPYMAHGYEELVTPMHMLCLYNAIANKGIMMKPYLVNAIRELGIDVKTFTPTVLVPKVCSEETLVQLQECLRAVVDSVHGTGHADLFDSSYAIAGKTGTAVSARDNKGYNKGNKIYQSSFVGYFPADNPRYSMAVVIQNSRESRQYYGAKVAGTVFKQISDRIYNHYLGRKSNISADPADTLLYSSSAVTSDFKVLTATLGIRYADSTTGGDWRTMNTAAGQSTLFSSPLQIGTALVPDLTGLGLKDAVQIAENKGMTVSVSGKGRVVNQSLKPGLQLNKGQQITLFLH
jgi:cell division protein FtsI (penicillin-binding protein 3)